MTSRTRLAVAKVEKTPFFQPWMGREYERNRDAWAGRASSCCEGLWHIMGESHYGSPEDHQPLMTRNVVERLALEGYPFFDTVLTIVADQPEERLVRATEWQNFAFSNFVQDLLPEKEKRRPTTSEWSLARQTFFGQLAITRPKQLLVVGREQWYNLPDEGFTPIDPFEVKPELGLIDRVGLYGYEVDGSVIFTVATCIYHPSSWGKLNIRLARARVRSINFVSCNIASSIRRDSEGYYFQE